MGIKPIKYVRVTYTPFEDGKERGPIRAVHVDVVVDASFKREDIVFTASEEARKLLDGDLRVEVSALMEGYIQVPDEEDGR